MSIGIIIQVIKSVIDAVPTKTFWLGLGDFDGNGKADVKIRIILDSGKPIEVGPINVAVLDIPTLLDGLQELIG